MKYHLVIFFLVVNYFQLTAQELLNQKDSLGRKQGHWIVYGKDRPESGIPADGKVEEGNYVDDKKEGLWIKYNDDGKTPKLQGEYVNNRPKGVYSKTGNFGKKTETGTFEKNKQLDSLKRFYDNGNLEYEAWYNEDGKEHGTVNYYYPTGQLEYTYMAKNGVPEKSIRYNRKGEVIEATNFKTVSGGCIDPIDPTTKMVHLPLLADNPNTKNIPFKTDGYNKVYNDENEILLDGKFVNGQFHDGKHYVYDNDGILLKVQLFKDGKYYADGQI